VPSVEAAVTDPAHILVVDDDPDLRRSLVEVLQDQGYAVSCATNGEEALEALQGAPPNAILLDLTMPVMDGWTFRRHQQDDPRLAGIPTVLITASYSDARSVASLGAEAFLAKPFEVSDLTETLRQVCGAPAAEPPRGPAPTPAPAAGARAAGTRLPR
jgi:CheY-like chemotaxis protein